MNDGGPDWAVGWPNRLRERIGKSRYATTRGLAELTSGDPLPKVAEMLGGAYAPFQIASLMRGDAIREGWTLWLCGDLLARDIHWICPAGWSSTETGDFARIHATVKWSSDVEPITGRRVSGEAHELIKFLAPQGWDPLDARDPVIVSVAKRILEGYY